MAITSWTSEGMNWTDPDPLDPKYWEAIRLAVDEISVNNSILASAHKFRENETDNSGDLRLFKGEYIKSLYHQFIDDQFISSYNNLRFVNANTFNGFLGYENIANLPLDYYDVVKLVGMEEVLAFLPIKLTKYDYGDAIKNSMKLLYAIKNELITSCLQGSLEVYARYGSGSGSSFSEALSNAQTNWNGNSWNRGGAGSGFWGSHASLSGTTYYVSYTSIIPVVQVWNRLSNRGIHCETDIFMKVFDPPAGTISTYYHPDSVPVNTWKKYSIAESLFYITGYQIFPSQQPPSPPTPTFDGASTYKGFSFSENAPDFSKAVFYSLKYNGPNGLKFV